MPCNERLSLTVLHLHSFRLQNEYDGFQRELQNRLSGVSMADSAFEESLNVAMEVLNAAAAAAHHDEVDGDSEVMLVDGEPQPRIPAYGVDGALKILINNATEEFGFAPRDVYEGIFVFHRTKFTHKAALGRLDYPKLIDLAKTFNGSYEFDEHTHRVIAVSPSEYVPGLDEWKINFKSIRIAEQVVLSMRLLGDEHLRKMYYVLRNIPQNSGVAGHIFEAIAHRVLPSKEVPQYTRMDTDGKIPPTFSTTTAQPPSPSRRDRALTFKPINLRRDLSDVDSNGYYIPVSVTNPLFDSFTVDLDHGQHTAVISIYQITISQRHKGSADGYLLIRKIIAHARKLLNCKNPNIEVKYFLVCPEDGGDHKWKMPSGWDKKNSRDNHIGKAFCIRIPSHYLTVRRANPLQIL